MHYLVASPLIRPRILANGFSEPLPLRNLPPSAIEALAPSPAAPFEVRLSVLPLVEFVRFMPVPFAYAGDEGSVGAVDEFDSAGENAGTELSRGEIDEDAGVSRPPPALRPSDVDPPPI